ncbi:hypothetical protein NBRC116583_25780 [Arenicella sp. 4NH20-0111]|uniref:DUF1330 domain-containing protein n=1 Tax=Arenicella sp. 4NH20-0111 TaxID=3127648 RepID=UPI00310B1CB8
MKDERVYMLNVLWFREDGGEERFQDYWKLAFPMIESVGGRKLKSFEPQRALEGDFDADLIFFVEYPNFEAFKKFANSPEHHNLAFMKKEAVENSLLVRCARPEKRSVSH